MAVNVAPFRENKSTAKEQARAIFNGEFDEQVPAVFQFQFTTGSEENIRRIGELTGYSPKAPEYELMTSLLLAITSSVPEKHSAPVTASDETRLKWARAAVVLIAIRESSKATKQLVAEELEEQLSTDGHGQRVTEHSDVPLRYILASAREYSLLCRQ